MENLLHLSVVALDKIFLNIEIVLSLLSIINSLNVD